MPEELFRSARSLRGDEGRVRAWRETLLAELAVRSIPHAVSSHGMIATPGLFIQWKPMIAFFLVIAILLGSGGAAVAASQNDLPGDALYGVKIATERVQEAFVSSAEKMVDTKAHFAERRAEELQKIAEQKPDAASEAEVRDAAARVVEYMNGVRDALIVLSPEATDRVTASLTATLDQSQSRLESARARVSSSTWDDVDRAMEATRDIESEISDDVKQEDENPAAKIEASDDTDARDTEDVDVNDRESNEDSSDDGIVSPSSR